MGERPTGAKISPVGPIEPADDDRAAAASASARALARRRNVDLADPVLGIVQLEPMAVAAERIGQDDVGAGLDEAAVQRP